MKVSQRLKTLVLVAVAFALGFGLRDALPTLYSLLNPSPEREGVEEEGVVPTLPVVEETPTPTPLPSPTAAPRIEVRPTPSPTPAPPPFRAPAPTPTAWKPVEKVTKLGIGVYSMGGGHLTEALMRLKPTVILLMDPDPEFARDVRRWFPKAFIIGRRYLPNQPLDNPQVQGEQIADHVAALALPLKGVVNAWMSYNEVTGNRDYEKYRAYNIFQVAFARKLQRTYGIDALAGNEAVGAIDAQDYPRYFAEAIQESNYFGIHAYAPQFANSLRENAQWYVLRYREIHEVLARAGIKHGPMILTEAGLWNGWRDKVSEESMAEDFMWLANELEKDPYVLGMAIFGLFANGQWKTFDLAGTSLLDQLGEYVPRRPS